MASILGKVSDEAARYAESNTLRRIASDAAKVSFAFAFAYSLSYPAETFALVYRIVSSFNFFPPKFAFWCFMGFVVFPYARKRYAGENYADSVEWIPVSELLDHLFTEGTFKRDDAEAKFAMPRNRYQSLAKRMDDLGIFVRGENNSRVLNAELSRQEVAALVRGERSASKLSDIRDRVSGFLSPALPDQVYPEVEMIPSDADAVETGWQTVPLSELKPNWNR